MLISLTAQSRADNLDEGVTLGSPRPMSQAENCVEVEVGGEKSSGWSCINQRLKAEVERVQPVGNIAPLQAGSAAVQVGGFSETAMSQQYGRNWGKSVVPFRPPASVFGHTLGMP
jgi:hypothetical protein